jgi:hypothetical protein
VGDELLNAYFQDSKTDAEHGVLTSWQSFELWGFTTPMNRKTAQLHVTPQMLSSALAEAFVLATDACAASVGENSWKFSLSIDHDDDGLIRFIRGTIATLRDGHNITQGTAEVVVVFRALLEAGLAGYPQTLEEDDALLKEGVHDARWRELIELRRGEKSVLQKWLQNPEDLIDP